MTPTFEYCTLKSMHFYQESEKSIIEGLHSHILSEKIDALKKGMTAFRIARNFKNLADIKNKKKILNLLDKINRPENIEGCIKAVRDLSENLATIFPGKNFFSASSKLLWLKFRSPIVILDSRTIKALNRKLKPEDYSDYIKLWHNEYNKYKSEILKSCLKLTTVKEYLFDPEMHITDIIKSDWFQERVFDIYLWQIGE